MFLFSDLSYIFKIFNLHLFYISTTDRKSKYNSMIPTASRTYPDVLETKDPSVYDYQNINIKLGDISNYKITQHIGKGKYSNVFEGLYKEEDKIIIKVLKPVRNKVKNREIAILTTLMHDNIVKLLDVVIDESEKHLSLIFEYIDHENTSELFQKIEMNDIKFYTRKILEALDYIHSNGIMHRDLKPSNIIVNSKTKEIKIIDWGLAEFYHPYQKYHPRVATRYYKSPEILLGYPFYDYSLDIWSFGCILGSMLFKKDPFFYGKDNEDQLEKIISVLGSKDLKRFSKRYNVEIPYVDNDLERIKLRHFFDKKDLTQDEIHCIDLLEKIFVYDHQERLTAKECLQHPFYMM